MMNQPLSTALLLAGSLTLTPAVNALDWQTNEIHYQYGKLDIPTFAGGGDEYVTIGTIQHASGWKYGDTFAFVDFSDGNEQGHDIYAEIYPNFSLGKISGKDLSFGPVRDVGIIMGYNWGDEAKVRKYLPGVRLALDVPGFSFVNLDVTAYIDDNSGVDDGGAPEEDDSYMVDVSWAKGWNWGEHSFSFEGHMEYIGSRDNEFGDKVEGHFLAQPQLRYDLGQKLWNSPEKLYVGVEFQYWENKLGDADTDERATQLLAVYRF